jgi:hypothetical protein
MNQNKAVRITLITLALTGVLIGAAVLVRHSVSTHAKKSQASKTLASGNRRGDRQNRFRLEERIEELRCRQALGLLAEGEDQSLVQMEDRLAKSVQAEKDAAKKVLLKDLKKDTGKTNAAKAKTQ